MTCQGNTSTQILTSPPRHNTCVVRLCVDYDECSPADQMVYEKCHSEITLDECEATLGCSVCHHYGVDLCQYTGALQKCIMPSTTGVNGGFVIGGGICPWAQQVRWCAEQGKEYDGETEMQRCEAMVPILNGLHTDLYFECVEEENCMEALRLGAADIAIIPDTEIHSAYVLFDFEVVLAETYGDVLGASYYSVAVLNANECNSNGIDSFEDLVGSRCA